MLEDWTSLERRPGSRHRAGVRQRRAGLQGLGVRTYKIVPKQFGDIPGPTTTSSGATLGSCR
jgi:hypothetical protein